MKQFDDWLKGRSRLECGGLFKSIEQCEFEAFRAGMLEAAYIAESFESDEVVTLTTISEAIREAADNGND